jgi:hypothetical protein
MARLDPLSAAGREEDRAGMCWVLLLPPTEAATQEWHESQL